MLAHALSRCPHFSHGCLISSAFRVRGSQDGEANDEDLLKTVNARVLKGVVLLLTCFVLREIVEIKIKINKKNETEVCKSVVYFYIELRRLFLEDFFFFSMRVLYCLKGDFTLAS